VPSVLNGNYAGGGVAAGVCQGTGFSRAVKWRQINKASAAEGVALEFSHRLVFPNRCKKACRAGDQAGCGGAAGLPNSASLKSGFNSIFSILISCVSSVGELPESMANANFNPPTSR
jgi:hypothetical protein